MILYCVEPADPLGSVFICALLNFFHCISLIFSKVKSGSIIPSFRPSLTAVWWFLPRVGLCLAFRTCYTCFGEKPFSLAHSAIDNPLICKVSLTSSGVLIKNALHRNMSI